MNDKLDDPRSYVFRGFEMVSSVVVGKVVDIQSYRGVHNDRQLFLDRVKENFQIRLR